MARELPQWAQQELGKMGIDDTSSFEDKLYGPIADRKSGLRRDDLVEILLDARSINLLEIDPWIRGRLISSHKSSIEILDDELVGLAFQKFECSLLEQRTFARHLE